MFFYISSTSKNKMEKAKLDDELYKKTKQYFFCIFFKKQ
jgi:hypothetical protein